MTVMNILKSNPNSFISDTHIQEFFIVNILYTGHSCLAFAPDCNKPEIA
jgi:hypothetical protein